MGRRDVCLDKDDAVFWDTIWKSCGKPMSGALRDNFTQRKYHYAVRRYKKEERLFKESKTS